MLKLECINIYNFKSFKGIHSITGFSDHFTAIVGPNGSGKSNIIDSILFVLGFKAKKMRHTVLRDLITSGCTEAFVELRFNEFTLRRSIKDQNNKTASSKYELDGKEHQAADIIKYLKEKGIDLDNNRFLILQGEIETIAMMNPLELLEYIEDCIGTQSYKPLIEKLEIEISSKQEEVDSLHTNLKFIESDYLFKKGRRDSKLEFLKFRNESLVMKDNIVDIKAEIATRKEKNDQDVLKLANKHLDDIINKNKESNFMIKQLEEEKDKLDLSIKEEKVQLYRNEFQRIQRDNKNKENKASRLEHTIEKLNKELEENKEAIKNWKEEYENLNTCLIKNTNEIQKVQDEIDRNVNKLDKFVEIKELEMKKSKLEQQLIEEMKIKERYQKEQQEIITLEDRQTQIKEALLKCNEIKEISCDKPGLEKEIQEIRKDIQATANEIAKRKTRQSEFEYLDRVYKKEREVYENLKSLPGVYGTVKELGKFDKKYEDAVEAATKQLNNIVVDTSKTAEECISIINKKKLNRTTFVILDKLSEPEKNDKSDTLSNTIKTAELLYKKIKCEASFNKLFYFIFKDTLCVSSLDEAKELAFGKTRRRVVTLDGKLFEKSGLMSGGKTSKKIKSAAELEEIHKNITALLNKKIQEYTQVNNREQERLEVSRNKKDYEREFEKISVELNKLKKVRGMHAGLEEESVLKINNIKHEILQCNSVGLPEKAKELKCKVKALYEQLNDLQKVNQEIRIALGTEPSDSQMKLNNEIKKLQNEQKLIVFEQLPNVQILNQLEEEFNVIYKQHKAIEDSINKIRAEMGDAYHEEAQLKIKIEELHEHLKECKKIKDNCIQKKQEIRNDFVMTRNLLLQIEPEHPVSLSNNITNFDEYSDQELKEKAKDMTEELNRKITQNFEKLKELEQNGSDKRKEQESKDDIEASNRRERKYVRDEEEEDLEIYRLIFAEFNESKKVYDKIKSTSDFSNKQLEAMKKEVEQLKNQRLKLFLDGYNIINKNIKEIFSLITFGGNAELDLLDYLNPFTEGIVLNIMPPKKAWKQISNLSGGEKTLSSLGLIFALHKFKPSCLYIMDEIDAALDYKNVSVISQYLQHVQSQFIVISLRNDMFEMARTLVGVYKYENISNTITVNLNLIC